MNGKMKKFKTAILLVGSLSVAVILLHSCKKSEPTAAPGPEVVAAAVIEQKICPVMGGAINPALIAVQIRGPLAQHRQLVLGLPELQRTV